jgi:hypothetical protein
MAVIIIGARKDICTGGVMITGIIWIIHIWAKCVTTNMNIKSGMNTTEGMVNVINNKSKTLCGVKRFCGRFTNPPLSAKGLFFYT